MRTLLTKCPLITDVIERYMRTLLTKCPLITECPLIGLESHSHRLLYEYRLKTGFTVYIFRLFIGDPPERFAQW